MRTIDHHKVGRRFCVRRAWIKTGAIIVLAIGAGCKGAPLCDPELKLDTTYLVQIAERYTPSDVTSYDTRYDFQPTKSLPSCNGWDGIIGGTSLKVRTNHTEHAGGCEILWGDVLRIPSGAEWTADRSANVPSGYNSYAIFSAMGHVVSGTCSGSYGVFLERPLTQDSVFAPTSRGDLPNLVVGRSFTPDGSDSSHACLACADSFVGQLAYGQ